MDAVIVGAGPAGSAAAYVLAKTGHNVVVVERGKRPGDKNVSGGVLFGAVLNRIIPNFWEDAPVERQITKYRVSFLSHPASASIDFSNPKYARPPYNGFSVIRSKFDYWFAKQAEDAGATLATGIKVDGLLMDRGKVVGIHAGGEEIQSDVVIAADGANSLIAQEAGLRCEYTPEKVAIGVKEVIGLSQDEINKRFNLSEVQGVAHAYVGCTNGHPGGGFLYTNKESVSLGVVTQFSAMRTGEIASQDLVDSLRDHPEVSNFIRDGELLEYSAHLVPEAGYNGISKLYTDGLLVTGDAAGLVLNMGYTFEGMNYAIASGILAAKTVNRAQKRNDYSKRGLKHYERLLKDSFVLKTLKRFKHIPALLQNPRMHKEYPWVVNKLATEVFTSGLTTRSKLSALGVKTLLSNIPIPLLIKDALQAAMAL